MDKQKYFLDLHIKSTSYDGIWHPLYKAEVFTAIERIFHPDIKQGWKVTDFIVNNDQVLVKFNHRPGNIEAPPAYDQHTNEDKLELIARKIYNGICHMGISQLELANQMGQPPSAVTRWLSGKHNFTVETLFAIEAALNITLFDIYNANPPA